MNYYSLIGVLAAVVLIIVNYDILFSRNDSQRFSIIKMYRKFLYVVLLYYITDILWGVLDTFHLVDLLFADTVIFHAAMALSVLLWTRCVIGYLDEDNGFSRFLFYAGPAFFTVALAADIINCFTPVLFYFDENGAYQTCVFRHVNLSIQILLLLLTSVHAFSVISQRAGEAANRYRTICLFGLVVASMLLIQLKYPLLPLYTIGYMLGTCLLHTFVINDEKEEYRKGFLSSRQHAKEQERISRSKSEFLSRMSHEIRTPINAMIGMNEMILRECRDKDILAYAENVKVAGKTLLGLVNDILDFSKIEAGKIELIPAPYKLSDMLNDLVNMVRIQAEEKGVELVTEFEIHTPNGLYGDEIRIKQIITNILNNAVKYTQKGNVTFSVSFEPCPEDKDSILLHVSVSDTGIGIRKEDLGKLFSRFERIEESRNRYVEGSGLGMTITARLLKKMRSSLQVESTYGVGSRFFFVLRQRVTDWAPLGDEQESGQTRHRVWKGYRAKFMAPEAQILVVDDMPMNLLVFRNLLKRTKVMIDTASGGDEALLMARDKKYDMIVLDHMMPRKDGIETLRDLRSRTEEPNAKTPAICLTANAISGARKKYIEAGFDDYLTKPIHPGKLEELLLTYLPEDKIKEADDTGEPEYEEDTDIPEVLAPLQGQDWIDLAMGIEYNGSAEAYLSLLKLFYESLEDVTKEIEGYFEKEDWENYTIKVHALKSTARLIGAMPFGEEALLLEKAGKNRDAEFIRAYHAEFLKSCRSLRKALSEVFDEPETEENKPEADAERLKRAFDEIRLAAEEMDGDRLEDIIAEMDAYSIPKAREVQYEKLKFAVARLDYEAILNLLENTI